MRSVIGPKPWVAAKMSLPPQWQKWAIPLMQYGVRFSELGHTGGSNRSLPTVTAATTKRTAPQASVKPLAYSRRQLLANAAIAASRVAS
jgi:hypothetical protein